MNELVDATYAHAEASREQFDASLEFAQAIRRYAEVNGMIAKEARKLASVSGDEEASELAEAALEKAKALREYAEALREISKAAQERAEAMYEYAETLREYLQAIFENHQGTQGDAIAGELRREVERRREGTDAVRADTESMRRDVKFHDGYTKMERGFVGSLRKLSRVAREYELTDEELEIFREIADDMPRQTGVLQGLAVKSRKTARALRKEAEAAREASRAFRENARALRGGTPEA